MTDVKQVAAAIAAEQRGADSMPDDRQRAQLISALRVCCICAEGEQCPACAAAEQLTADHRVLRSAQDTMTQLRQRAETAERALSGIATGLEMPAAMDCLRHMLAVDFRIPMDRWGYRNSYTAEPGHHRYSGLLLLKSLGLAIEHRPGHWSATVSGAQVAGLTEQQIQALGLGQPSARVERTPEHSIIMQEILRG